MYPVFLFIPEYVELFPQSFLNTVYIATPISKKMIKGLRKEDGICRTVIDPNTAPIKENGMRYLTK